MKSIMQNEKACYLTGYTGSLHKPHIYGGNGRRHICEAHGFWCYLRPDLHNLSDNGVHFNHELDLQLKQECQRIFEQTHTRDEFMRIIHRNYLDLD